MLTGPGGRLVFAGVAVAAGLDGVPGEEAVGTVEDVSPPHETSRSAARRAGRTAGCRQDGILNMVLLIQTTDRSPEKTHSLPRGATTGSSARRRTRGAPPPPGRESGRDARADRRRSARSRPPPRGWPPARR